MSTANFIPTVWAGAILRWLEKSLVYASVCNRNYEGDIKNQGDSVKINQIGDITVNTYAKTDITVQTLNDAAMFLKIDQAKYFAFSVDDMDKVQSNVNLLEAASQKAGYAIRDTADQFIATKYADAGVTTGLGTTSVPLDISADGAGSTVKASNLMSRFQRRLDDAKCPKDGRWLVIPPWLEQKLILEKILLPLPNGTDVNYDNGRIGQKVFGFDVRVSQNVPVSSSKYRIMAGSMDAITYADQIVSVESFRPDLRFSDAVKGLHVYGAKVVRADCLASACCTEAAT